MKNALWREVVCRFGTSCPDLCTRNKNESAMIGTLITLGLTALAIWLLVDSAVEFIRDGQEDNLATEP